MFTKFKHYMGFRNFIKYMNKILLVILFLSAVSGVLIKSTNVIASPNRQTMVLFGADLSQFPTISHSFKLQDSNGQPINDLNAEQVNVIENEETITIDSFEQKYSGIHTILAINADAALDKRDTAGISIYSKLMAVFDTFQAELSSNEIDLWSLTLNQERQYLRLRDPDLWFSAIENYQPDMRNANSSLTSLQAAINNAALSPTTMDQILIYITPEPLEDETATLTTLAKQATDKGVRIHIWMVGQDYVFDTERGKALASLAQQTGGSIFVFDGNQSVPDPQTYLAGFGSYFTIRYTSKITTTGTYDLKISAEHNGTLITSADTPFFIDVQPPQVLFLSPPTIIEHEVDLKKPSGDNVLKSPKQDIKVQILFPDSHPRGLEFVKLYVNSNLVQENTQAPFESFTWDYSRIEEDTTSILQVRAKDALGFEVASAEFPVEIKVIEVESEKEKNNPLKSEWVIPFGIAAAALISLIAAITKMILQKNMPKNKGKIPLVDTYKEKNRQNRKFSLHFHPPSFATLERVKNFDEMELIGNPIDLIDAVTTIGSNPILVKFRINDQSVNPVHARITLLTNGKFVLSDMSSSTGTRLNNSEVNTVDTPLQDGDLIQFGNTYYRIQINYRKPKHRG